MEPLQAQLGRQRDKQRMETQGCFASGGIFLEGCGRVPFQAHRVTWEKASVEANIWGMIFL